VDESQATTPGVKTSRCQLEYVVGRDKVRAASEQEQDGLQSRLHVISFDIECAGRPGVFPEPLVDPVIQIGSLIRCMDGTVLCYCIHTWRNATLPLLGVSFEGREPVYVVCRSEHDMINRWFHLLDQYDVDVYTGYNTDNFDLPYLIKRADHLRVSTTPMSRVAGYHKPGIRKGMFESKAYGKRQTTTLQVGLPLLRRETDPTPRT